MGEAAESAGAAHCLWFVGEEKCKYESHSQRQCQELVWLIGMVLFLFCRLSGEAEVEDDNSGGEPGGAGSRSGVVF